MRLHQLEYDRTSRAQKRRKEKLEIWLKDDYLLSKKNECKNCQRRCRSKRQAVEQEIGDHDKKEVCLIVGKRSSSVSIRD